MAWPSIEHAQLTWRDDQPVNTLYADHYFAREGGLDETRYVFLQHNNLPQRWSGVKKFVIAETGFGTGLNFFATLDAWLQQAPTDAVLMYYSVEKHPLTLDDMRRVMSMWPTMAAYIDEFSSQYPGCIPGYHTLEFAGGRVVLVLMLGDAVLMLSTMDAVVDAWYLDGFAPAKNPGMWNDALFTQIGRLSAVSTHFATFTAAGFVRRGLLAVGFKVDKFPGFGDKREMLCGELVEKKIPDSRAPWFYSTPARSGTKSVVVIGGGISGATTAHVFAKRGWQVQLFERRAALASEASGNPVGIVMPRLTLSPSVDGEFFMHAFLTTTRWLNRLRLPSWRPSGVLKLLKKDEVEKWRDTTLPPSFIQLLDQKRASEKSGASVGDGGVFIPQGGYVSPVALCNEIVANNPRIVSRLNVAVGGFSYIDGEWHVFDQFQKLLTTAPFVVLANGNDAASFSQTAELPFVHVRGQLSYVDTHASLASLRMPVVYGDYVTPAVAGRHCVGASFSPDSTDTNFRAEEHENLLRHLRTAISGVAVDERVPAQGRVAVRTACPDRLPMAGAVPVFSHYQNAYADLRHGKAWSHYAAAETYPGLYINAGHGARGLTSAYVTARLIANQIDNLPLEMPRHVVEALHPARFWLRVLKRQIDIDKPA